MTTLRGLSSLALCLLVTGLLVGCSRPPAPPPTVEPAPRPLAAATEAGKPVSPPEAPQEVAAQEEMRMGRTSGSEHPKSGIRNPKSEMGPAAPAKPGEKPAPPKVSPVPPAGKPTAAAVPPAPSKKRKAAGEERQEETSVAPGTSAAKSRSAGETEKKAPLVVLGEVLVASHVPEPGTVPYTECLTFIKYKVISVESGEYEPSELLAVHWGMKDNQLTPAARYRVGERHRLELEPFDAHPELARVMQADDTNEYELAPYWVRG